MILHVGGYGTLEELLEVITWAQLGIHDKPVCFIDINIDCRLKVSLFIAKRNIIYVVYIGRIVECGWLLQFLAIIYRQGCGRRVH